MTVVKLFAVRDIKSEYFFNPFPDVSVPNALRGFQHATNKEGSTYGLYPDDFALFELGTFDTQSGVLTAHSVPVNIATARSVLLNTSYVPSVVSGDGSTKVAQ